MMFDVKSYVQFNEKGRGSCPSCELVKQKKNTNLALVPGTDGAYKCHRGCSTKEIREALGAPKDRQIPAALAAPAATPDITITVSPQKVREACEALLAKPSPAREWLNDRGISDELIRRYQLGASRAKCGAHYLPAISIPLPNPDKTAYYQKKRVAPWQPVSNRPANYKAWSQYGIPTQVWFSHLPAGAKQTILCEGEWDTMLLGDLMKRHAQEVAVACFTGGCGNLPRDPAQLAQLPGIVYCCYDLDEPGRSGAEKVARALGERAKIMTCPVPLSVKDSDRDLTGWDVSDAIRNGATVISFRESMKLAITLPGSTAPAEPASEKVNPLRERLILNDDLIDAAPDFTEWLVPDLLTNNELFLVAAGPRAGKSLLAMTLALAVATGGSFLERPVIQGPVIYVCLEDSPGKLKEREIAQGWTRNLPVYWLKKFKLSELPDLKEIAGEIDPRLIIIDTLSRAKDGMISESSAEMSQVLEPLQEMAEELDCTILLVHHTGKVSIDNASQVDIFDTIRGSSAIRAVCRGSMVIAAANDQYRLVAENGWGKHDLKVVLDNNTQTWRLLGNWTPSTENSSQKAQILDFLKKTQVATLNQIHEHTGIPKKSLHEQLKRLGASKNLSEKVCQEGSRRNYTYSLALFNSIQLLNSVLNSEISDTAEDSEDYSTKNDLLSEEAKGEMYHADQNPAIHISDPPLPPTNTGTVDYRRSNPEPERLLPSQQLVNTLKPGSASNSITAGTPAYSTDYSTTGDQSDQSDQSAPAVEYKKPVQQAKPPSNPFTCQLKAGDVCSILKGRYQHNEVKVLRYDKDYPSVVWVAGESLRSEIAVDRSELGLLKRSTDA